MEQKRIVTSAGTEVDNEKNCLEHRIEQLENKVGLLLQIVKYDIHLNEQRTHIAKQISNDALLISCQPSCQNLPECNSDILMFDKNV